MFRIVPIRYLEYFGPLHWHLLLFVEKEQANELIEVSRDYAMAEDGDEEGATKHRFTVERIDRAKGTMQWTMLLNLFQNP